MNNTEKILLTLNVLTYIILAIFSYAYVDLNLTLSTNPLILDFVGLMQQLGYYNRPIASIIYITMILSSFFIYSLTIFLFMKSKISFTYLKVTTIINTLILVVAYPFLSSDLFNYIFDAKIILNYQANPYTHQPLDFPNDDWLRFMRWVHRYSPYGPFWLGFSLIPAFLGFGKFIINLFTFKIFIALFHLINSYVIYKILKKIKPKFAQIGTAFYALNPTILIEGVANAHNDVVLATFLIVPIYYFTNNKKTYSIIILIIGALVKYIPILNIPWIVWAIYSKKEDISKIVTLSLITMILFTYIFSSFRFSVPFVSAGATQVQFQPWYLFWTLPYVALLTNIRVGILAIAVSLGASFRYLPFIYYGDWSHPGTTEFMQVITFLPAVIILIYFSFTYIREHV